MKVAQKVRSLILWPDVRSPSYFKSCSNNGQFGERYACQPVCLPCNLTVLLPTAVPTQGTVELQLSGLIGTASHPDNWTFLWEDDAMTVCSSAVTIYSMYMRVKPLRAGRSGDGILVGARFSVPVQTGPEALPASNTRTMGTGSFPGVKRPGRGVDHPPPSSAEVKKEKSYTSPPSLDNRGLLWGELYLRLNLSTTPDLKFWKP
jgi:hypothetical protein